MNDTNKMESKNKKLADYRAWGFKQNIEFSFESIKFIDTDKGKFSMCGFCNVLSLQFYKLRGFMTSMGTRGVINLKMDLCKKCYKSMINLPVV